MAIDKCVEIGIDPEKPDFLHVELSSATFISFDLELQKDYVQAVKDCCYVAPHMMELDADLMEMYDDAGRTLPKGIDILAVKKFLSKYRGRLPEDLSQQFDLEWNEKKD